MKSKVALCLIAKDKEDIIQRALQSTRGVFDYYCLQDTGSTDKTIEAFERWCKTNNKEYFVSQKFVGKDYKSVLVDGKEILGDFASARQDSFNLIPKDCKYAFWIDTDDVIVGAEQLPALVEIADKNDIDQVIAVYDYASSPDGLKPVTQQRERLINIWKKGHWKNRVHENYQFDEQARVAFMNQIGLNMYIRHERTAFEALSTNRRNHLIMKAELEEVGIENFSDEMLNHYAFDMWEHREFEDCIKYYKIFLKRHKNDQINPEVLFQVHIKVARAYQALQNSSDAFKYAFMAVKSNPHVAEGYLLLGELFAEVGNWNEVEYYATRVLQMGKPETTAPINEYDYYVVPRRMLMQVYLQRNELNKAMEISKELEKILPGNPQLKQEYHNIYDAQRRNKVIQAIGEISMYLQENNKLNLVDRLFDAIPLEFKDDDNIRSKIKELSSDYKRKYNRVVFIDDYEKSIVIFAGQGYEQWDGESDIKKGIGGSEGMCIQLARELAKLGNKVFIYNDCGESDGKVFDGVMYVDYRKWNGRIKSDIFISLRRPDVFSQVIKAKKQYLWLHDTEYGDVPLVNIYVPNKIIVLTDYHKNIIKINQGVKDDNHFWISKNGLNKKAIDYADVNAKERKPYQLIYGSSYDRGLDHLLAMWPKIKAAVPEATLKIFYGTVTMDKMIQMKAQMGDTAGAQAMQQYKSMLMDAIGKLDGVQELGRVSQEELYKNFKESSIWIYPTSFTEISCITAMTAQAMGAVPVCTPVAALNETVNGDFGIKTDLDKIADATIYLLKNQDQLEAKREPMVKWARQAFDMSELAKEWNTFFNED